MNISAKLKLVVFTLPNMAIGNARTNPILKIFVPMILPIIISYSFFLTEVMAIISSGDEVPITKIIIVTSFEGIFNAFAKFTQLSTAKLLPK